MYFYRKVYDLLGIRNKLWQQLAFKAMFEERVDVYNFSSLFSGVNNIQPDGSTIVFMRNRRDHKETEEIINER
jgi:hypothetical protein